MTLGERIQEKRKELGLSQEALGEALGVTRQSISKWESDAAIPELDKLIALSRLFRMTVGELLGVEEDSPAREELTARELKALEAIAAKLAPPETETAPAPGPPKKKRRWPKVLAACAAGAAVLYTVWWTADRLERLEQQVSGLQYNVNDINRNVSLQVNSIAGQVKDILEQQNQVAADMGAVFESVGRELGTATFRVWAVPRTWREGMTAQFSARVADGTGEYTIVEIPGTEGEGHRFEAVLPCAFTDDITFSVTFVSGGESRNQIISRWENAYRNSRPSFDTFDSLQGAEIVQDGESWRLQMEECVYLYDVGSIETLRGTETVRITQTQLRLWRGEELIWSQEERERNDGQASGSGLMHHFALGIDVPLGEPESEEWFYLSICFTDTLGRRFETLLDVGRIQWKGPIAGGKPAGYKLVDWPREGPYPWGETRTVELTAEE